MRQLNALGYGSGDPDRSLNLVYNPIGPSLPPAQASLEADYKRELGQLGLQFDHLLTLANMPIQRFARQLELKELKLSTTSAGGTQPRQSRCSDVRSLISVDWTGRLFDCDFNQQLGMACTGSMQHLRDLLNAGQAPTGALIRTDHHCFGCTAGAGSSCGGALQR